MNIKKNNNKQSGGVMIASILVIFMGTLGLQMWADFVHKRSFAAIEKMLHTRKHAIFYNSKELGKILTYHYSVNRMREDIERSFDPEKMQQAFISVLDNGVPLQDQSYSSFTDPSDKDRVWRVPWGSVIVDRIEPTASSVDNPMPNYFGWSQPSVYSYKSTFTMRNGKGGMFDFNQYIKSKNPVFTNFPVVLYKSEVPRAGLAVNLGVIKGNLAMAPSLGIIAVDQFADTDPNKPLTLVNETDILAGNALGPKENANFLNFALPPLVMGDKLQYLNVIYYDNPDNPNNSFMKNIETVLNINPGIYGKDTIETVTYNDGSVKEILKKATNSFGDGYIDGKLLIGFKMTKIKVPDKTRENNLFAEIDDWEMTYVGVASGAQADVSAGDDRFNYAQPIYSGYDFDDTDIINLYDPKNGGEMIAMADTQNQDGDLGNGKVFLEMANANLPKTINVAANVQELNIFEYLPVNSNPVFTDKNPKDSTGQFIYPQETDTSVYNTSLTHVPESKFPPVTMIITDDNLTDINFRDLEGDRGLSRPLILLIKRDPENPINLNFADINPDRSWSLIIVLEDGTVNLNHMLGSVNNRITIRGGIISSGEINIHDGVTLEMLSPIPDTYDPNDSQFEFLTLLENDLPRHFWVESYYNGTARAGGPLLKFTDNK